MSKLINIKSLLELFKKYDVDESGHIDFDEFLLLMQDMNLDITEGQARSLFILVDVDNSKEIDTQEFFSWWTKLSANSSVDDVTGAVTIIDYIYRLFRQSGNVYDGAIPAEQFQSVWNTIKKKFERTAHVDMASAEDLVTRFRIGGEKMVHLSDIIDWLPFYHLRKYAYLLTPNNSPRRPPKKATGEVLPQLPPDNLTASNIPLPPPPPLPPTNYKIQRTTQEMDIEVKARSTPPPKRTQNSNQNADFADEIKRAIQARLRITHEGDDTPSIGVTTPTPESSRKSSNATPPRIESPKSRDKPFIPKLPLHVDKRTPPKNWLLNPSPRPQLSDASCQTDPVEKEVEIRKVYIREPAIQVVSSPSKSEQQFEYVKKQNEELKKQVQKLEDLIDQSGSIPNITKQYQQMEIRCKEAADEIHKLKNLLLVYQSRSPRAVSPHTPRSVIESPTTRLLLSPRTPNSGSPNSRSPITRVSNEQIQYPSSSPRKLFGACYKYADTTFAVLTAGYARVNLKPAVVAVTSRQQSKKELGGIKQFIIDKGEWAIPSNQKKAPALKKVATTCFQNKHQSFILIEDTYCNVWEYLISSEEWKKLPPLPPKSKIFCSIYRVSANSLVVIGEILSSEYDFVTREWYTISSGIPAINFERASVTYKEDVDCLYVTDNRDLWIYSFENVAWSKLKVGGDIPRGLIDHSSVVINDKYLIVMGGKVLEDEYSSVPSENKSLYIMDLSLPTLTWYCFNIPNNPIPPRDQPILFFSKYDHKLYIVGGKIGKRYQSDIYSLQLNLK